MADPAENDTILGTTTQKDLTDRNTNVGTPSLEYPQDSDANVGKLPKENFSNDCTNGKQSTESTYSVIYSRCNESTCSFGNISKNDVDNLSKDSREESFLANKFTNTGTITETASSAEPDNDNSPKDFSSLNSSEEDVISYSSDEECLDGVDYLLNLMFGRSTELDIIIANVNYLIDNGDIPKAAVLMDDVCKRLDASYRSEKDQQYLNYMFYFLQLSDLYLKINYHSMALETYYKGILNTEPSQVIIPFHVEASSILWRNVFEVSQSLEDILKLTWKIKIMADKKINKDSSNVPACIYQDIWISFNTITQHNKENGSAKKGKLRSLLSLLKCLISQGEAEEVPGICKRVTKEYSEDSSLFHIWALALKEIGEIELSMRKTEEALLYAKNNDDRRELSDLLTSLENDRSKNRYSPEIKTGKVDNKWLLGTNYQEPSRNKGRIEHVKENHVKQVRRRPKARKQTFSSYYDFANWYEREINSREDTPMSLLFPLNDRGKRKKVRRKAKSTQLKDIRQKNEIGRDIVKETTSLYEELLQENESDNDFEVSECLRSQIFDAKSSTDTIDSTSLPYSNISFYEQSVQNMSENEGSEEYQQHLVLHGVGLSKEYVKGLEKKPRNDMYHDNNQQKDPCSFLKENPGRFKKCVLKIESAHKARCILLNPEGALKEIEINSRSKCGKNFCDDEVVVEVLNSKDKSQSRTASNDSKVYGKVVTRLQRNRFRNIKHPVLVCQLDEFENHLVCPLDKTVPKLQLLRSNSRSQPHWANFELYRYDREARQLVFQKSVDINPAERNAYVFLVVFIRWDTEYPLGAVINIIQTDGDIDNSLRILQLLHQVPTTYTNETVKNVECILNEISNEPDNMLCEGRENMTELSCIFSIDPPNTEDIDDVISVRVFDDDITEVGVHIADVTSYVCKGDSVDQEAKERATSFYPVKGRRPHHMFPEPLSQNHFSLLPNKSRFALSLFYRFSADHNQIGPVQIKKTVVKSRRQFTYKEVQEILLGRKDNDTFSDEIRRLYSIIKTIRKKRLCTTLKFLPVEIDPLSGENIKEAVINTDEALSLVEELMILSNKSTADYICSKFKECALLRCQSAPSTGQIDKWLKLFPKQADIIMRLQNIKVSPTRSLGITHVDKTIPRKEKILFQNWVWTRLQQYVQEGDLQTALKLIRSDEVHPEQALALEEWIEFQETAEYRCLGSLPTEEMQQHFTLGITRYAHFTSPIRRYADIVTHRLMHAALDDNESPYSKFEIEDICFHINEVSQRAKKYEKQCKALDTGFKLRQNMTSFQGFVNETSDQHISCYIPGLKHLHQKSKQIKLNLLSVSKKPNFIQENENHFNILTLTWQKRLYSHIGFTPAIKGQDVVRLDPHQNGIFQQLSRWVDILKASETNNIKKLQKILSVGCSYQEDCELRQRIPVCTSTVDDVSSEVQHGTITKHFCEFSMSFSHAQIISVHLGAKAEKGLLVPYPQLVELTDNIKLCLTHHDDPVKELAKYSTLPAHAEKYRSVSQYLDIWLPLVHMEAATLAARNDSITVNKQPVRFREQDGTFSMTNDFCEERNIDFRSMSLDLHLQEEEQEEEDSARFSSCSCYLCFKCPYEVNYSTNQVLNGTSRETKIWLAHGQVDKIKEKEESIQVHFLLQSCNPKPPHQILNSRNKQICSVEIMEKPESIRRTEAALNWLVKASDLAKTVALGKRVPRLDNDHMELGKRMETDIDFPGLASNNEEQHQAIEQALSSRLTFIHGPPGTGKTYTGIKLLYLFTKLNKIWHKEGNPLKQIVFCGPSNKSVDLVADWTLRKLGQRAPRIVRMYGSLTISMDYPIPGKVFGEKEKSRNRTNENLKEIALHHLIRKEDRPYAEGIRKLDKYFQSLRGYRSVRDKDQATEFKKKLKEYKSLVGKAETEELAKYDVIFCTTALTTKPSFIRYTKDRIYQCIIDESGMCTEPECLATIIATRAEQVVMIGDHKQLRPVVMCQYAAKMGLDKSLFERYADQAILLTVQYRMNPRLCDFVSCQFYEGKLETAPSLAWDEPYPLRFWRHPRLPHIFCHIEGEEDHLTVTTEEGNERSCSNKLEVEKVVQVFEFMVKKEEVKPKYIAVLSQYNAQCHAIKKAAGEKCNVQTVVASQGGEWDYVIISTVRSLPDYRIESRPTLGWCKQNLGFITDEHQANVALSRARKGLVIIGNKTLLKCDKVWRNLLEYYEENTCVVDAAKFPPVCT